MGAPSKLILACTDACHLIKRGRVRLFRVDSHVLSGSCLSRLPIDVVELKPIGLPGNVHANSQIPKSPHNLFSAMERMSACCHECSVVYVGARGLLLLFLPSPALPGWFWASWGAPDPWKPELLCIR